MIKADTLIKSLNLVPHPEGGYFKETYQSEDIVSGLPDRYQGQSRSSGTSIYYLLKGNQYSAFHKIQSDEIWHFYEGSPLKIYVIDHNGKLNIHLLGNDINNGGNYQIVIKHNQWFAAQPIEQKGYTLMGCTVSPGFDYTDFQLAKRNELLEKYPEHHSLIMEFTRD